MELKEVGGSSEVSENKAKRMENRCIRHQNQAATVDTIGLAANVVAARYSGPSTVCRLDGFDAGKARQQVLAALLA